MFEKFEAKRQAALVQRRKRAAQKKEFLGIIGISENWGLFELGFTSFGPSCKDWGTPLIQRCYFEQIKGREFR